MPPKAKFTKDEIVNAALSIVKSNGVLALSARALSAKLESSTRPIFTVFQSMEEIHQKIFRISRAIYNEYIATGLSQAKPFKGVGMQYIQFATDEPKLFQLLFMVEQPTSPNINNILPLIDENYSQIVSSIQEEYGLDKGVAESFYKHIWLYTHGIATLHATKTCIFSKDEIASMLQEVALAQLKSIKAGKNQ